MNAENIFENIQYSEDYHPANLLELKCLLEILLRAEERHGVSIPIIGEISKILNNENHFTETGKTYLESVRELIKQMKDEQQ